MWSRRISGLLFCVPSVFRTVFATVFLTVLLPCSVQRKRNEMERELFHDSYCSIVVSYSEVALFLERLGSWPTRRPPRARLRYWLTAARHVLPRSFPWNSWSFSDHMITARQRQVPNLQQWTQAQCRTPIPCHSRFLPVSN